MADAPADDKSKKKKRLDDLLSGLHAGKGNSVPEKKESPMDSLFRKATESATDLNKLQEMLGPLGGNPGDAKVGYYNTCFFLQLQCKRLTIFRLESAFRISKAAFIINR